VTLPGDSRVRLGEITCPSGQLVIMDGGYLGAWSGDRSPAEIDPELLGIQNPETITDIQAAVDFDIVGPDAAHAARAFDRQPGHSIYDMPGSAVAGLPGEFAEFCRVRDLDARLRPVHGRVSHRDRVRRCALAGGGGFHAFGIPVVAMGGLPADRSLPVEAERFEDGWRWQRVVVADAPAVRSEMLGYVAVDWARLAFADADALASWQHTMTIDGLADVIFWGLVAEEAAAVHQAGDLDGQFGWEDLPVREAAHRFQVLTEWQEADPGRRMKVDFRPHSHHWQVMADVRASDAEAGVIDVGGARLMFAMTSWGDGWFPVRADYDADGGLVAVRVELVSEETAFGPYVVDAGGD
jgi:hypothetical protein